MVWILCVGGGGGVSIVVMLLLLMVVVVVMVSRCSPWNEWPATMVWISCVGGVSLVSGGVLVIGIGEDMLPTMERVARHHGSDLVLVMMVVVGMTRCSQWNEWPATTVWILGAGVVVDDGGGGGTVGDSGLFCCVCVTSFKR